MKKYCRTIIISDNQIRKLNLVSFNFLLNILNLLLYYNVKDTNSNSKFDINDFLEMSNEEILKDNNNKKFDICLMNPPYDRGLGDKFLLKIIDISNKIISIQPINFLLGNKKNIKLIEKLKTNYVNIDKNEILQKMFHQIGAVIGGDTSIIYIDIQKDNKFLINNKEINIDNLDNIRHYSGDKLIEEFHNKIKKLYEIDNIVNHYKNFENNEFTDDNNYCIKIPRIRGHKYKGIDPDFYTILSNNDKFINEETIGKFKDLKSKISKRSSFVYYISFESKNVLDNFIKYLKTDFCRTCLYLLKTSPNVISGRICRYIPWFDFSDEHFSKSPKEIDNWLFEKYNISDEIRKHIKEILPDYYNIR